MVNRVTMTLLFLGSTALLALPACTFDTSRADRYFSKSERGQALDDYKDDLAPAIHAVEQGRSLEDFYPENIEQQKQKKDMVRLGLSRNESKTLGCDMGDRFDKSAALAYNFSNQKTRLSLHLSVDGPSLSNPSNLEFNSLLVRFTHKFQKPSKSQQKKCQFPSQVQGLVGSIYNEFFVREKYTILDEVKFELKERGLDLK